MKKSNLYTRGGDRGTTSLVGGERVRKNDVRVEAYGTVDELNAVIGLLMAECKPIDPEAASQLENISARLFDLGSYLASIGTDGARLPAPSAASIAALEAQIDSVDASTPPFRCFLLPGGHHAAAQAHVARTICRRAERRLLDVADAGYPLESTALEWINRLSDYLFALSRYLNHATSTPEIEWKRSDL
ncbi:MAG: cob(I)yrinic acid a,c-diamide adenosyltransferase [Bacteroides sp.]|nr:cob(I)yrinic acid a,c-diamide adenosyltransferase [Bacteroidales bacterium]MBD5249690.1 cob(I)yrinic acid a,c-diamide adenosyltransferase [Barnesiella sp.]MBD5252859.1 cob(I)yrinic acid a,c-diamide adenosyltransferase [Barnesiella sp.]MBD5345091.1 cob(I)yrinic acid a,c-diamide adenosyltransferase [Bacteroides sp.]MBD5368338.1 cob(I)yrinic acid a,c-diamide adenosyltransferase [Bacteroides sp.]